MKLILKVEGFGFYRKHSVSEDVSEVPSLTYTIELLERRSRNLSRESFDVLSFILGK